MDATDQPATAVEKYFFHPIYYPRSAWSVVRWWESRRLLFNASVGAAGLVTTGSAFLSAMLPPHPMAAPVELVAPIVIYGVMANVCFSLGAPVDLLLRRILGDDAPAVGQALFRYGFAFSMGLTLLPVPFFALAWLMKWFIR